MARPKSLERCLGSRGPACPKCNHERSSVIDRRQGSFRRRVCAKCDHRFTTYEVAWPGIPKKAAQRLHKARDLISEILDGAGTESDEPEDLRVPGGYRGPSSRGPRKPPTGGSSIVPPAALKSTAAKEGEKS